MNYKILLFIVLSNLLSVAYAIENRITSLHPLASNAAMPPKIFPAVASRSAQAMPNEALKRVKHSVDRYQGCFANTIWIVPPQTLLAYLYDNATVTPAVDQTVWVFSNYNQGYFSGQSYTEINGSILSQRFLIGSVTTDGRALITFYSGSSTSTDLVSGMGTLNVNSAGQCSFLMQMNSGQNGVSGLIHWSYMIPVNPGDFFYNNLPGTAQLSVPQFLAQF